MYCQYDVQHLCSNYQAHHNNIYPDVDEWKHATSMDTTKRQADVTSDGNGGSYDRTGRHNVVDAVLGDLLVHDRALLEPVAIVVLEGPGQVEEFAQRHRRQFGADLIGAATADRTGRQLAGLTVEFNLDDVAVVVGYHRATLALRSAHPAVGEQLGRAGTGIP